MKSARKLLGIVLFAAYALGTAKQVSAQGGVVVENVRATYAFGVQITFLASIKASSPVRQTSIVILDEGHGTTLVQPLAIQADGSAQFVFDVRQHALRPFTFVRWHYELLLGDGTAFQSETFFIRYDDNRFAWQRLESNNLNVSWVQGDQAFAQTALNTAVAGLRAVNEIFPVDRTRPINIYIYPSQADLAFLGSETWLAGHADAALGVTLVVIEPELDQSLLMEQRIPHEMMHVLLYRNIGPGYARVPAWLREGLATMVEINPTPEYDRALRDASSRGTLIPLTDLCGSFPSASDSAFLAYAEARSFTSYLRDSFGSSKLIELARQYADGVTCERGVELVYDGTSFVQLEMGWRESALGENAWGAALRNMLPYLILLCLVMGVPLSIGFNAMRRKK